MFILFLSTYWYKKDLTFLSWLHFFGCSLRGYGNRETVGWNTRHTCQIFFLLESSLNFSIPFFPAFYDKQIISYRCSQKLDCDTVLSAAPVDCLLEICFVSKTLIFVMLVVGQTVKSFFWKEVLPLLFWTCPYWRFGNTMVKIFDPSLRSKLNSGMEFCAHGTAQCALSVCYTVTIHWPCPRLLPPSACVKRMLKNSSFYI